VHDAVEMLLRKQAIEITPVTGHVAAVSVGVYEGVPVLDLDYLEDSRCDTDMNIVMTDDFGLVEMQGTAEGMPFSRHDLDAMLDLAQQGIRELIVVQKNALNR
jgi:ribonuclease PH